MSRRVPALDVHWPHQPDEHDTGALLAAIDEYQPTALDDLPCGLRVFFASPADRGRALDAIAASGLPLTTEPLEVDDDAWAERSQAGLTAVRVGALVVRPPWDPVAPPARRTPPDRPASTGGPASTHVIVIQPSMGFGTGHHASTRLCLALLQHAPVAGAGVLDAGTGSGVLALAAWRLGAARVVGIDVDPDAVASARENLELNGAAGAIDLRIQDLLTDVGDCAGALDLVTANLTGALLERHAAALARLLRPGGRLIASGFQDDDELAVTAALGAAGLRTEARLAEDGWVGIVCARASP